MVYKGWKAGCLPAKPCYAAGQPTSNPLQIVLTIDWFIMMLLDVVLVKPASLWGVCVMALWTALITVMKQLVVIKEYR